MREQLARRPTPDDPYLRTPLFFLPCFGEDTPGNGEGGVGRGRPAVDGALEEASPISSGVGPLRTAARPVQLKLVEASQRDERGESDATSRFAVQAEAGPDLTPRRPWL